MKVNPNTNEPWEMFNLSKEEYLNLFIKTAPIKALLRLGIINLEQTTAKIINLAENERELIFLSYMAGSLTSTIISNRNHQREIDKLQTISMN